MLHRYTNSSQNALTITVNLLALVLLIAGLFVIPGQSAGWITAAGLLLLATSGVYSW